MGDRRLATGDLPKSESGIRVCKGGQGQGLGDQFKVNCYAARSSNLFGNFIPKICSVIFKDGLVIGDR